MRRRTAAIVRLLCGVPPPVLNSLKQSWSRGRLFGRCRMVRRSGRRWLGILVVMPTGRQYVVRSGRLCSWLCRYLLRNGMPHSLQLVTHVTGLLCLLVICNLSTPELFNGIGARSLLMGSSQAGFKA
jgi:hypothetical protein